MAKFLGGLNGKYTTVKSPLLVDKTIPNLPNAFSSLTRVFMSIAHESQSALVAPQSGGHGRGFRSSRDQGRCSVFLICTHCGRTNHTSYKC